MENESVSLGSFKSELDSIVSQATSLVDLVDKYADLLRKYAGFIPAVGTVVTVLDDLDKALHTAQSALNAV